ncbi:outer membrane beta-barrel family protein [uncultured Bacteroides sp.]|uniref:outer membrane beta-barrel family protein n=1 Tax=uncultured Bacteroides sp. TaxID=162156 RepID=UPI002AAACF5D|nr:outer membrane beta-barrel family protein [uncultured Bacteroides sp.]
MKTIYLFLVFLFPVLSNSAQSNQRTVESLSTYTVKGTVIDSISNQSVQYATLSIAAARLPQNSIKVLVSDNNGNFNASFNASPGNYIVTIQFVGMKTTVKRFTLSSNQKLVSLGKIYMAETSKELNEVVVVAQKPLVKIDIDKLTYSIENDPESKTTSTLDMLRKIPMITVDNEDNIQLKGSSDFKIYLNGKPSNMISNNPSDVLKSMPASTIKSVEVITDPGAKYDAEGVGGIINIITTKSGIEGYTATVRGNASALGRFGGGTYLSLKAGKIGITGNYNYNYNNSPYNDSYLERTNSISNTERYMAQNGRSKNKGPFQFGTVEASYEIDSLNLISLSFDRFNGDLTSLSDYQVDMKKADYSPYYSYDRNSNSTRTFGSTEVGFDYQRSTHLKDELLTISYQFENNPNNSKSNTLLKNLSGTVPGILSHSQYNINNASTNEHTVQIDYTRPIREGQKLETGVKYILRNSNSETDRWQNDTLVIDPSNDFKHIQKIYSAYLSYDIKINKFSIKVGAREEGTSQKVKYNLAPDMNFNTNYSNLVPSATVSYMLSDAEQIRFGYTMRIRRPGIRNLNPYVNNTDPQNISYGNPGLNPEKSNNLNLNYSLFTRKLNINASLSYNFVNNGIESYTFIDPEKPNVSQTTYDNIGHTHRTSFSLYGKWNASTNLNVTLNGGIFYVNMKSDATQSTTALSTNGFFYNGFTSIQYTFPKDLRLNLNGGYFAPRINLQGKSSAFYFTSFSVSKDLMNKKLSVSLTCSDPFWKTKKYTSSTTDNTFSMRNINYINARDFRISVSYRFGTLKTSATKKAKKGITNEDIKTDENPVEGVDTNNNSR